MEVEPRDPHEADEKVKPGQWLEQEFDYYINFISHMQKQCIQSVLLKTEILGI